MEDDDWISKLLAQPNQIPRVMSPSLAGPTTYSRDIEELFGTPDFAQIAVVSTSPIPGHDDLPDQPEHYSPQAGGAFDMTYADSRDSRSPE